MKKLLLLVTILIFFSCAKDDYNGNDNPTVINLQFATNQQVIPVDNGLDLYAVQIYISTPLSEAYTPYAYGLFDNQPDIKINLPENVKYRIESTVVVNAKRLVSHDSLAYYEPFVSNDSTPIKLSNKFIISNNKYFNVLSGSKARIISQLQDSITNHVYKIPALDRYYGEIEGFEPELSSKVDINMDRVVFGMNLTINNTTRSTVSLRVEGTPDSLIVESGKNRTLERLYTLPDFTDGDLSDPLKIKILHNNGDVLVEGQGEYFVKKHAREIITLTISKADKTKANYNYDIERIADFY